MTVQETLKSNHQIEVVAGTEVVWAALRFDRVWFPAGSDVLVFKAAPVNETPRAPSRSPLRWSRLPEPTVSSRPRRSKGERHAPA